MTPSGERDESRDDRREEREDLVREWFLEAVEVPAEERERWLEQRLGDDPALKHEVEELLRYDAEATERLPFVTQVRTRADGAAPGQSAADPAGGDAGAPREEKELPERIGPFAIEAEIGVGGNGVVYRARQDSPRRVVALKVLPPEIVSPDAEKRFRREVDVLARLRHPGIVRVLEAGTAEDDGVRRPYFAMELIEGRTLDAYLRGRERPIRERVALLLEIADAVHHAHRKGVLHRDLKPSNVLVEHGRPRILDFGIAKATGRPPEATKLTADGAFLGTLPYMSPEQATADPGRVGVRSDLYSLGVLAFEVLTGKLPYSVDGRPLFEALRIITECEPARPSRVRPGLPQDLDVIVGKLLAKEPERRYASAAALAEDLRRFLASEPIQARPPTFGYRVSRAVHRHRGASIGMAVATSALLVGAIAVIAVVVETMRDGRVERSKNRLFLASVSNPLDGGAPKVRKAALEEFVQLSEGRPSHRADAYAFFEALAERRMSTHLDDEARSLIEICRALLHLLEREQPREPEWPRQVQTCRVRLANLDQVDDPEGAFAVYLDVRDRQLELLDRFPDHSGLMDDLAWSYRRIGDALRLRGEDEEARQCYLERHRLASILVEREPRNHVRVFGMCDSLHVLAGIERDRRLEYLRAAYRITDHLREVDEAGVEYCRYRSRTASWLSAALLKHDGAEEALRILEEARPLAERNARSDGARLEDLSIRSSLLRQIGRTYILLGDVVAAEACFVEALDSTSVALERNPVQPIVERQRISLLEQLALLAEKRDDLRARNALRRDRLDALEVLTSRRSATANDLLELAYARLQGPLDSDDAEQAVDAAAKAASLDRSPSVLRRYADILRRAGEGERAAEVRDEAARLEAVERGELADS